MFWHNSIEILTYMAASSNISLNKTKLQTCIQHSKSRCGLNAVAIHAHWPMVMIHAMCQSMVFAALTGIGGDIHS